MVSRHELELLKTFKSLTACSDDKKAKKYMAGNNWNINYALNEYYDKEVGGFTEEHFNNYNFKYPDELVELFKKYAVENTEGNVPSLNIDAEGLIEYIQDLGYKLDDLVTICLAKLLECKSLEDPITEKQFLYFWYNEGCTNLEQMKHKLEDLDAKLVSDWKYFTNIYNYTFEINSDSQQSKGVMETDIAIEYWHLFFEYNRDKLSSLILVNQEQLDLWSKFLKDENKTAIHQDTWQMLLLFFKKYPTIELLKTDYDEAAAWPYTIDEYYEYLEDNRIL
ncbi:Defective in cullin neddylation protein 1 [Nakaseomyces bracarensis]|uniref:Defective in cullin neddylation protein n=1 Tax=Nakaseomyces bracarensis TaxID=273131 RepID=A0ABR4NRT4_9SACH